MLCDFFEILFIKIESCELTYAKVESLKHKNESFEMRLVREHTNTSLFTAVYGKIYFEQTNFHLVYKSEVKSMRIRGICLCFIN